MGAPRGDAVDQEIWRNDLDALVIEVASARATLAAAQAAEAQVLARAVDLIAERERHCLAAAAPGLSSRLAVREVSAELGAAVRVGDQAMQCRIGDAAVVVAQFPKVLRAWRKGRIDAAHVAVIRETGTTISTEKGRRRFERKVLKVALVESAGRLREPAQVIAARIDPEATAARLGRAASERNTRVRPLGDGLARVQADIDAVLAYAIDDRLTQIARSMYRQPLAGDDAPREGGAVVVRTGGPQGRSDLEGGAVEGGAVEGETREGAPAGGVQGGGASAEPPVDGRTMDQLRADAFTDLLLTATPIAHGDPDTAVHGRVQVMIPAMTLLADADADAGDALVPLDDQGSTSQPRSEGQPDGPALLAGFGVVCAATVRRLAAAIPTWSRLFTDPFSGQVFTVDSYQPTAAQRRFLAARDERCRFPGCRRRVERCDVDHTVDAATGGATSTCNLAHLCRRHHTMKHHTDWRVRQLGGGVLEWTSPTGRTHRDRPPGMVRFLPDPDHRAAAPLPAAAAGEDIGPPPPF
ncbi:DUF222 domain-containing protein [Microbacterium fluvii]|uniref:DUF222 domain-containing protein n=1 Tax=Microbacterium fluvii TaxID=415215 RepID=A0ABW2HE44_9MICO|nr:HNH endonuclease signature motif containing protein [Microbacterium fluvii]MCU4672424.1 HNH endonuclease [Microbacterium fluvii]